jgi:hypothetical protein
MDRVRCVGTLPQEDKAQSSESGGNHRIGESSTGLHAFQNLSSRATDVSKSNEVTYNLSKRKTDVCLSDMQHNAPRPDDDEDVFPFSLLSESQHHRRLFESGNCDLRVEAGDNENSVIPTSVTNHFYNVDPQAERYVFTSANAEVFCSSGGGLPLQMNSDDSRTNPILNWLRNTKHTPRTTRLILILLCSIAVVVVVTVLVLQMQTRHGANLPVVAPNIGRQATGKRNQFGCEKHCFLSRITSHRMNLAVGKFLRRALKHAET